MQRSSRELDPGQAQEPAAHVESMAGRAGPSSSTPLGGLIADSPRVVAQRRQIDALLDSPIQLVRSYEKRVLEGVKVAPEYTSTKVGAYTVPKRMLARPLALPDGLRKDKRETENTPLWRQLKAEQESIAFKDGHLLNHGFGGPADSTNMVPISADANAQMIPFDAHVASLLSKGAVVDLEVAANYGRSDGLTTAQNSIPSSLDMRMIPQRDHGNAWVDDQDEPVIVQNVVIQS